jgi:glucosylceramidase
VSIFSHLSSYSAKQADVPEGKAEMKMESLLRVLLASLCLGSAFGQQVSVVVSSKAGDRLTTKAPLVFVHHEANGIPAYSIETGVMLQRMVGFGASFLEAGMICLNDLPPTEQEGVLRSLFDPVRGAGFSAMKTPIAGTDFMSAGPYYTYDDVPGDVEMKHFSIQRDLGPNGVITYIKRARKYGKFVLQSPMDYPPDWMLIDPVKHQDVDPKYYDALARYYLRFLQEYQQHGVFIDYLSLFNEPWNDVGGYTRIKYSEIRDLLKNHVGPLLNKAGVKSQIMLSEAPFRSDAAKGYPTVLDDPEARQYVKALPYHGYDFWEHQTNFDKVAQLHHLYPDLPLWMTEVCYVDGAGKPPTRGIPRYEFEDGAFWGNMIISDIQAGASAWIYWNMILDQHGGPWMVSPVHHDPDPNAQQPVVIVNRATQQVSYTGLYYYLAHFSKFIRPGAVRAQIAGDFQGLRALAFLSPEPEGGWHWVVELLNDRSTDTQVSVEWQGRSVAVNLPATSITTCLWNPTPGTIGNMPAP